MQSLTRTAHTCGKEVSRNQEAQHPTGKTQKSARESKVQD